MRAAAPAALLAVLALPAPARADFIVFGGPPGFRVTAQAQAPVAVSGAVTVDFHGDPAAGCAQRGLCDVSGTVTWRPQRGADLSVVRFRTPKRHGLIASLSLFGSGAGEGPTTSAQAQRAGAATACADASTDRFASLGGQAYGTSVRIGPGEPGLGLGGPGADLVGTRCPGPLMADVAPLLPSAPVTFADAARGDRRIDLSGQRALSAGGFAGTVRSTLVLRLGRGRTQRGSGIGREPARRHVARRMLTAEYAMRVAGTAAIDAAGVADPATCDVLDSCGLSGTVTLAPPAASANAYLTVDGPGALPAARLRASIGLSAGPRPAGVQVSGLGYGTRRATAEASFSRDGAPGCQDRAPTAPPAVSLAVEGGRMTARLIAGDADLLHTRCGGPSTTDVAGQDALARGSVPLAAMRAPTVTIPLTAGRTFSTAGYRGRVRPSLTVVLRRKRVRSHLYQEPAGLAPLSSAGARARP